jgi:hypothetical protein
MRVPVAVMLAQALWPALALAQEARSPRALQATADRDRPASDDAVAGARSEEAEERSTTFLALCRQQRVELLAQVDPRSGLEAITREPSHASSALPQELGGMSWYTLDGRESGRVPAATFAAAQWTAHGAPDAPLDRAESPRALVLGACDRDGALYATFPLAPLERSPLPPVPTGVAVEALREAGVFPASGDQRLVFLHADASSFDEPAGWEAHADVVHPLADRREVRLDFWAVMAEGGKPVLASFGSADPGGYTSVPDDPRWARLGSAVIVVAIVDSWTDESAGRSTAQVLLIAPGGRFRSLPVELLGAPIRRHYAMPRLAPKQPFTAREVLRRGAFLLAIAGPVASWFLGFARRPGWRWAGRILTLAFAVAFSGATVAVVRLGAGREFLARALTLAMAAPLAFLAVVSWIVLLAQLLSMRRRAPGGSSPS